MFAIQTLSVLKLHSTYNTKIKSRVDVRATNCSQRLQVDVRVTICFSVIKALNRNAYNTKMQKFQGGGSRSKLVVSLKFTTPTIQRYGNFRVDLRVTSL